MHLETVDGLSAELWDRAISSFDSKYLFHQSAWLAFLEETQGGEVLRFRISEGGDLRGYFAGLVLKKGPFKILGSPLKGWTTNYMGPIVNRDFDYARFIPALEGVCRQMGIHHVELCHPRLDGPALIAHGFAVSDEMTMVAPLFPEEQRNWKNLKSECRNRVRKGMKNGLVVEEADDPAFITEYYAQLQEVFAKQQLVPTYPVARVGSLFNHLKPNLLFALRVRSGDEVIATGLFPHDERCVYFFGGASRVRFQALCPNEILHWTAMQRAAQFGIREYNMCGGDRGHFKAKFGSRPVTYRRYFKSYSPLAKLGRRFYQLLFHTRQKVEGRMRRRVGQQDD